MIITCIIISLLYLIDIYSLNYSKENNYKIDKSFISSLLPGYDTFVLLKQIL